MHERALAAGAELGLRVLGRVLSIVAAAAALPELPDSRRSPPSTPVFRPFSARPPVRMHPWRSVSTLLFSVVLALGLAAGQPLSGHELEREAREIDAMLIAPCCFTQQVSVHQSAAAAEVRSDVRARLAAGQTREEILDAYVSRYGRRVLAEPPAEGFDRTLYILPIVVFAASLGLIVLIVRRFARVRASVDVPDKNAAAAAAAGGADEERLDHVLRDLD